MRRRLAFLYVGYMMERNDFSYQLMRQQRRLCSTLLVHQGASGQLVRRPNGVGPLLEPAPQPCAEEQQRQAAEQQRQAEEQRRQAELEQELRLARDIQQGLLLAAVPYLRGWELTAVSAPARDLGGDLYDFLPLQDGWQGIMIGDVSGKGLPAALRMAVARTVFRHEARRGEPPALTLAAVNRGVCTDIPQGMVTMLYIMLHPERGLIRLANAGHTYPILLNDRVEEVELSGMPLGVDPDMDYEELVVTLEPGTSALLYTDGVTEATNGAEEMFGSEQLQVVLEANRYLKPRALMRLLLRELRTWSPDTVQDDDITMVILRRRFTNLTHELRSIADDVLGAEQAAAFWDTHVEAAHAVSQQVLTPDEWAALLTTITNAAKAVFNRGLSRELSQQFRLAIEEYREGGAG